MTNLCRVLACLALVASAGGSALAQSPIPRTSAPPPAHSADEPRWSGSVSLFTYILADEANYAQPTISLDRDRLHLEARFNYEDKDTGSAWVGYNISVGDAVTFEIAPMIGAIFGNTNGVGAGYTGSLTWRRLDLSSQTELVFDAGAAGDSFLYTWSELGWTPVGRFRTGLVVQRTKVYQTEFDIQRGFFAGIATRGAEVTAYVLNPDVGRPTVVVGVALTF